ncbi:hypothetical protein H4R35_003975 [Dimargaris xerosporica]|nr:hypothetical protein H4R35_003975 [Dimargaris xerosporica]
MAAFDVDNTILSDSGSDLSDISNEDGNDSDNDAFSDAVELSTESDDASSMSSDGEVPSPADPVTWLHCALPEVKGPTGTLGQLVPITPAPLAKLQLTKWHSSLGHPGYDHLLAFAQQRLWCDQLVALVDHTTCTCHTCQLNAILTRHYSPQSMALAEPKPGEHLYLDFGHVGDLNEPDMQFMIMVNTASKFYQVVPLSSITAQDAVEALQCHHKGLGDNQQHASGHRDWQHTS